MGIHRKTIVLHTGNREPLRNVGKPYKTTGPTQPLPLSIHCGGCCWKWSIRVLKRFPVWQTCFLDGLRLSEMTQCVPTMAVQTGNSLSWHIFASHTSMFPCRFKLSQLYSTTWYHQISLRAIIREITKRIDIGHVYRLISKQCNFP